MRQGTRPISEQAWQDVIVEYAHLRRWKVAHFRPGLGPTGWATQVQYDAAGFPDLVLVRERVVFSEAKSQAGRVGPDQRHWIDWLRGAGAEVYVWRPDDGDEVQEVLR